ncbi:L-asparaginase [Coprinopsis cinerea okayama7|uniref:asparaginase n=1 Tax=Coprinopsis cinerea (strain Okayama-7 / 130 / ATCC MYA-4618 / FGSC 9003) TaxID=240176 RepID=A8NEP2_COPC7|nr:L-asparaginase [Coprinopsis cinerea okayama7\|eukprot:XP_001833087.2 L-asparaginase [Coprinopsis cinerea okayama7\
MELPQPGDESRVLVIYTGGTIGMLVGQQGYVPEPYFLTETLRSQSRFHDPLQDSLFSHSGTVQGFRNWSRGNGRSESPQRSSGTATPSDVPLPTLRVRSTRPIGHSSGLVPDSPLSKHHPRCKQIAENVYEANLPSLVTPRTKTPGSSLSKSIRYAILEWNPLLDSSNMDMSDWIRIATEIELNYNSFDAFVILHGTDTMSYTSSALSFLLEDLGKTVIITGAQIPLSQLRNDATDNLMGALSIAGHYIIPECCLYFNHTLFRGNRVTKVSSNDLSAFDSPNFQPLVKVGIDIVVNWNDVIRQTGLRRFKAYKALSPHVATLRLFPGITGTTIKAFCSEGTRGVVLETFGAGNAPQRTDVIEALREACDRGVVIVAISQCMKGAVSDVYETGRTLMQAGVVPGIDMTPECALTKLSYLLTKPELSVREVRELMGMPLRGELTRVSMTAPSSSEATINQNMDNIQHVLNQFVRLSARPGASHSHGPQITLSTHEQEQGEHPDPQKTSAPWTWTAAEAAYTEAILYPFLIHLAASKNDLEALRSCLGTAESVEQSLAPPPATETPKYGLVAGGIVNCLEAASGRSPLHVAALNGHTESTQFLLQSGALVHLRDTMGHTALYYAARQGHEATVDALVQAGATLGGADRRFAKLLYNEAMESNDEQLVALWKKCGM